MNLYLIGYRCTGKTSVGKCLARRMQRDFVDTDERVVEAAGRSVAEMVADNGWDYFRGRESAVLETLAAIEGQVVSTGGGIILGEENRRILQRSGRVVWLTARVATILARMEGDTASEAQRPALTGSQLEDEVRQTLTQRLPFYAQTADFALATDFLDIEEICDEILRWLQRIGD